MKKNYIKPQREIIYVRMSAPIQASLPLSGDGEKADPSLDNEAKDFYGSDSFDFDDDM